MYPKSKTIIVSKDAVTNGQMIVDEQPVFVNKPILDSISSKHLEELLNQGAEIADSIRDDE